MKIAKAIAVLGLLAMTAVLVYGFTIGDLSGDALGHRQSVTLSVFAI